MHTEIVNTSWLQAWLQAQAVLHITQIEYSTLIIDHQRSQSFCFSDLEYKKNLGNCFQSKAAYVFGMNPILGPRFVTATHYKKKLKGKKKKALRGPTNIPFQKAFLIQSRHILGKSK